MKIKALWDSKTNVTWIIRVVEPGEPYGLDWDKPNSTAPVLVNQTDEPFVEFYDTRHSHTDLGQFVSRYLLSTLRNAKEGLALAGGVPSWSLSAEFMATLNAWLSFQVFEKKNVQSEEQLARDNAEKVFQNFDFKEAYVVDFDGWEYDSTLTNFSRIVYLETLAEGSSEKLRFTVELEPSEGYKCKSTLVTKETSIIN